MHQPAPSLAQAQRRILVLECCCHVRSSSQASSLGFAAGDEQFLFLALKAPRRDRHRVHQESQIIMCSCKLLGSRRPPFFWQGPLPPASDGVGLPGIASTRTSANTAALISHSWEPSLAHFSGNLIKEEVELSDKEINLIEVQLRLVRGNAAARAHANIVNAFFVCILERVYFGSCKVC